MNIHEIFSQIEHAAGTVEKSTILLNNINDTIVQIYQDCYDPQLKYGVHKFEPHNVGTMTIDADYSKFHELLMKLAARELTGNAAIDAVGMLRENAMAFVQSQKLQKQMVTLKWNSSLVKANLSLLLTTAFLRWFGSFAMNLTVSIMQMVKAALLMQMVMKISSRFFKKSEERTGQLQILAISSLILSLKMNSWATRNLLTSMNVMLKC